MSESKVLFYKNSVFAVQEIDGGRVKAGVAEEDINGKEFTRLYGADTEIVAHWHTKEQAIEDYKELCKCVCLLEDYGISINDDGMLINALSQCLPR